jgi:uncharacterized lipoprotein YajG
MLSGPCRRRSRAVALAINGLAVIASLSLLVGCASRKLPISYVPQQHVQVIKGADAVPVEVRVEDLQPETFDHYPLNPLDDTDPNIHFLVKDAAETIKQAAETELKARGFKIATGGALITIEMMHFEADYSSDWSGFRNAVRANLLMRVQVRPRTGKSVYSQEVGGESIPASKVFVLPPARHELQDALEEALKRLFADPQFTAAILGTRQPPPAKPAVSPGRIAGAFPTMSRR